MIQRFADWLVYDIFGLSADTSLGIAVNFFFYDTVKILILLFFISVLMGIINAYFPIERLRNYLVTHKMYGLQYLLASLFGAITPFCSCSSIPLFIGFVKGYSTWSYICISDNFSACERSCCGNVSRFIRTESDTYICYQRHTARSDRRICFGKDESVTLSERLGPPDPGRLFCSGRRVEKEHISFFKRLPSIVRDAWRIVRGVLIYILIGIGIGAFMHGFVPEGFF